MLKSNSAGLGPERWSISSCNADRSCSVPTTHTTPTWFSTKSLLPARLPLSLPASLTVCLPASALPVYLPPCKPPA
eukprot:83189-Rhodomonas_salina.1